MLPPLELSLLSLERRAFLRKGFDDLLFFELLRALLCLESAGFSGTTMSSFSLESALFFDNRLDMAVGCVPSRRGARSLSL